MNTVAVFPNNANSFSHFHDTKKIYIQITSMPLNIIPSVNHFILSFLCLLKKGEFFVHFVLFLFVDFEPSSNEKLIEIIINLMLFSQNIFNKFLFH